MNEIADLMIRAAIKAGKEILQIYDGGFTNVIKADGSPVTVADKKSEEIILSFLQRTNIPVLAEESAANGNIPDLGNMFFCVDPLDGTKEFIKKNGEFTINIALIENKRPVLGLVTMPAKNIAYIGGKGGSYKFSNFSDGRDEKRAISVARGGDVKLVASRSHKSNLLSRLKERLNINEYISIGSAVKFCLLAEGRARLYPRFTHTYEWDSAAGQAILEGAGGVVLKINGEKLDYNKSATNYLNPYFVGADNMKLGKMVAKYMYEIVDIV